MGRRVLVLAALLGLGTQPVASAENKETIYVGTVEILTDRSVVSGMGVTAFASSKSEAASKFLTMAKAAFNTRPASWFRYRVSYVEAVTANRLGVDLGAQLCETTDADLPHIYLVMLRVVRGAYTPSADRRIYSPTEGVYWNMYIAETSHDATTSALADAAMRLPKELYNRLIPIYTHPIHSHLIEEAYNDYCTA